MKNKSLHGKKFCDKLMSDCKFAVQREFPAPYLYFLKDEG